MGNVTVVIMKKITSEVNCQVTKKSNDRTITIHMALGELHVLKGFLLDEVPTALSRAPSGIVLPLFHNPHLSLKLSFRIT